VREVIVAKRMFAFLFQEIKESYFVGKYTVCIFDKCSINFIKTKLLFIILFWEVVRKSKYYSSPDSSGILLWRGSPQEIQRMAGGKVREKQCVCS
jgi:hypothetical protein